MKFMGFQFDGLDKSQFTATLRSPHMRSHVWAGRSYGGGSSCRGCNVMPHGACATWRGRGPGTGRLGTGTLGTLTPRVRACI